MIDVRPASSRYTADHGWLKSNFSFSFAEYADPQNTSFGPLRVFNDDVVAPGRGFGAHPHKEMEIVSVVLSGQLEHQDSAGHTGILKPGEVQRMSAGTGIVHAEMNPSPDEEVNFLQLWFMPQQRGLSPSYEQLAYDQAAMKNRLLPVVSGGKQEGAAYIHQDLTLYLAELEAGAALQFEQREGRRIYVFAIGGDATLTGHAARTDASSQPETCKLHPRDAARITGIGRLEAATAGGTKLMLIDLP